MCTGGIARSGLGRVVYALSTQQFTLLSPEPDWPTVAQEGPALFEEARAPIEEYYRLLADSMWLSGLRSEQAWGGMVSMPRAASLSISSACPRRAEEQFRPPAAGRSHPTKRLPAQINRSESPIWLPSHPGPPRP
jgi:tRNA(Arg) A34 adenosine deaminase TadA